MAVALSPSMCDNVKVQTEKSVTKESGLDAADDQSKVIGQVKKKVLPFTENLKPVHTHLYTKGRKFYRKRRYSTTEDPSTSLLCDQNEGRNCEGIAIKHRRSGSGHHKKAYAGDIILPTNFLLGGNIRDPLNLNSMLDESVNRALNAVTPSSSPLPPRSSKINIVIPTDMTDPLGLNMSHNDNQADTGLSLNAGSKNENKLTEFADGLKNNSKKKKRRRKSHHEKASVSLQEKVLNNSSDNIPAHDVLVADVTKQGKCDDKPSNKVIKEIKTKKGKLGVLDIDVAFSNVVMKSPTGASTTDSQFTSKSIDPIVSPVIPQDIRRNSTFTINSKKRKNSSVNSSKQLFSQLKVGSVPITHNEKDMKFTSEHANNEMLKGKEGNGTQQHHSIDKNKSNPPPKFKPSDARFQFGNYNQYYGYRNNQKFKDIRMECLLKEWFKEKDVLDVGCNVGHLTLLIARNFSPRKVVGIDIDEGLIKAARNNIRHYVTADMRPPISAATKYPDSLPLVCGPIVGPPVETGKDDLPKFPNNIMFLKGNYVPEKDEVLEYQEPEYDVILCMSVTKWIHLNWGDEGLMKTFHRFFKQLRPGGKLFLEPQEWKSYGKKKKLTETTYNNYHSIKLKPADFPIYLTTTVGFEKVEYLQLPVKNKSEGFQRPIQLYFKPE